jgi:hypothetical protein
VKKLFIRLVAKDFPVVLLSVHFSENKLSGSIALKLFPLMKSSASFSRVSRFSSSTLKLSKSFVSSSSFDSFAATLQDIFLSLLNED